MPRARKQQYGMVKKQDEVKTQLSDLSLERNSVASEITSQALKIYEEVKLRKGQSVARVEQGMCQGCRLTISMSELQRARTGTLVQCSSCGRILFLG